MKQYDFKSGVGADPNHNETLRNSFLRAWNRVIRIPNKPKSLLGAQTLPR